MQEIVRVAREERLIILCTIHQPSTKVRSTQVVVCAGLFLLQVLQLFLFLSQVYNGFDQLMIMSRGREAFAGDVSDAIPYFESIGFPCPANTNPAEFYLDLVNSDFSDEAAITQILDTWEEKKPEAGKSSHHKQGFAGGDDDEDADAQEGVAHMKHAPLYKEIMIMFRRHAIMIVRDPILYIGRSFIFLITCMIFAFVYWNGRAFEQDQGKFFFDACCVLCTDD
jgi:hypothetical protein